MRHLYLVLSLVLVETTLCLDTEDRVFGLLLAACACGAGLRWAYLQDAHSPRKAAR